MTPSLPQKLPPRRARAKCATNDEAAGSVRPLAAALPLMHERRQRRFLFGCVLQGGRCTNVFTPFPALRSGSQCFAAFPCGSDVSQSVNLSRFSPLFTAVQMGRILLPFPVFRCVSLRVRMIAFCDPFPFFHHVSPWFRWVAFCYPFLCFTAVRRLSVGFVSAVTKFSKPLWSVIAPARIAASSLSKEGLESIR